MKKFGSIAGIACGLAALAGGASGSIDYVSQSREYSVYAYRDDAGPRTGVAPDFSPFSVFVQSDGYGDHGEHAHAEIAHASTLGADDLLFSSRSSLAGERFGGGQGGGFARSSMDITFTLASAQRYDFIVTTVLAVPGFDYNIEMTATLDGEGGRIFAAQMLLDATQTFSGMLTAGTYRYRVTSSLEIGPIGPSSFTTNAALTIPTPASVLALAGGVLAFRRRR